MKGEASQSVWKFLSPFCTWGRCCPSDLAMHWHIVAALMSAGHSVNVYWIILSPLKLILRRLASEFTHRLEPSTRLTLPAHLRPDGALLNWWRPSLFTYILLLARQLSHSSCAAQTCLKWGVHTKGTSKALLCFQQLAVRSFPNPGSEVVALQNSQKLFSVGRLQKTL